MQCNITLQAPSVAGRGVFALVGILGAYVKIGRIEVDGSRLKEGLAIGARVSLASDLAVPK